MEWLVVLQALRQLVTACMEAPPLQMPDGWVVLWRRHLLLTVQDMLKYVLSKLAFVDKVRLPHLPGNPPYRLPSAKS